MKIQIFPAILNIPAFSGYLKKGAFVMKGGFMIGMVAGGIIGMAAAVTTVAVNPNLQSRHTKRMVRRGKHMLKNFIG